MGHGWVLAGSGHEIAPTAKNRAEPLSVTNCGWINCSVYYSRYQTLVFYDYVIAMGDGASAVIDRREGRAGELLAGIARRQPGLFAHWRIGLKPVGWTMGAG